MTLRETATLERGDSGHDHSHDDGHNDVRQWTIKNLDAAVVEKTRAAAKKRGMKINAWVALALNEAAVAELEPRSDNPKSAMRSDMESIVSRIEAMRSADREFLNRIERDVNQLVRGQNGILTELLSKETKEG